MNVITYRDRFVKGEGGKLVNKAFCYQVANNYQVFWG